MHAGMQSLAEGFRVLNEMHAAGVVDDYALEEAVAQARELEYEGVKVRVVSPEHLGALALQAGGARRRERACQLLEAGQVDRQSLRDLLAKHGISAEIPDDV